MLRRLIYIPIIHTQADLGSLANGLDQARNKTLGPDEMRNRQGQIDKFWTRVQVEIFKKLENEFGKSSWGKLRIYQDALPLGGDAGRRIVEEVAKAGSVNHQILLELLRRGAHLERTEDADLLQEEYRLVRAIASAENENERRRAERIYQEHSEALVIARDRVIAARINDTLQESELGMLFVGASHRVLGYLSSDIEVIRL